MFRWIGRAVTKSAPIVIIVILLISMVFALFIPKIEFKTNLNKFLPDNELVNANERVRDYFGDEQILHVIYIEKRYSTEDLLSADALREQYDIYRTTNDLAYVEGVMCIAAILNEIFYAFDPENYTGFEDISDSDIDIVKWLFFGILNGSISFDQVTGLLPDITELSLDELRETVDIFFDKSFNYYSPDPTVKSSILLVFINGSIHEDDIKRVTENIQIAVTDEYTQFTVKHTGAYVISSDLNEVSSESFSQLGIVIIILIAVILFLTFRRISYVVIPLITLALAIIWTFGTMVIIGIEFSIIMVAVIPLIIGLGVDYSVYVSKRYQEELRNGKDITEAMEKAISSVGIAMFLAVITTIIAFMSNISSEILPLREFGLVCGLGIFYAFFLTLTFHTSLRWLIDIKSIRRPTLKKDKELYLIDLGTSTASRSVMYYPALIMIIVIIATIGGILFGMNVRTEFNDRDFLPNEWESIQTQRKLEQEFNGSSFSQAYILLELEDNTGLVLDDDFVSVDTLRGLEAIEERINNDHFVVRVNGTPRIDSILDHVQTAIKNNKTLANMIDQDGDLFPDNDDSVRIIFDYLFDQLENDKTESIRDDGLGAILLRSRVNRVLYRDQAGLYRATVVRVYVNVEDSDEVRTMYNDLKADAKAAEFYGMKKTVTGDPIQTITTMDSLQESQIFSTIISMIFAMVILIIIYRNIILGLIAMTPVLISSIWILGTMYIFGISINVFTVSITALTIGLGIDYAIHIIERYREECKSHDTAIAIQRTIRSTGTALFISALTTVCGFTVLLISPIPPIQHFGIITGMTIIYSSILAVVVIPILLMRYAKNKSVKND